MTYRRFQTGQEVSVITPSYEDLKDKIEHLTVSQLAGNNGSQVILSDGSKWRQSGDKWGSSKSWSGFEARLTNRKNGLQREQFQIKALAEKTNMETYRSLLDDLIKCDIRSKDYLEQAKNVTIILTKFLDDVSIPTD